MSEKLLSEQHSITPIEHRNVLVGVISLTAPKTSDLVLAQHLPEGGVVLPPVFCDGNATQARHSAATFFTESLGIEQDFRRSLIPTSTEEGVLNFHGLVLGGLRQPGDLLARRFYDKDIGWMYVNDFYGSAACNNSLRALQRILQLAQPLR